MRCVLYCIAVLLMNLGSFAFCINLEENTGKIEHLLSDINGTVCIYHTMLVPYEHHHAWLIIIPLQ